MCFGVHLSPKLMFDDAVCVHYSVNDSAELNLIC